MKIPANSFITLVEYTDPDVATVQWTVIDGTGMETVKYSDPAEVKKINLIAKQQIDVVEEHASDMEARADALRKLAEDRSNG